ncbi:hypothetical protein Bca52824_009980 [Brassica carinata]|uniref:Uncharacterized protein n=1 Tax=Brassica carinata TaxID=52824 RepID=A0A8X8BAU3_BRACI|nr:hypothetical protein Bca52824_009980 [Brassica carinata]
MPLRDQSRGGGADIKAQSTTCAQYKLAVTRLRATKNPRRGECIKRERLSRHLASLRHYKQSTA